MKKIQHYKKLSLIMAVAAFGLLSSCKDEANTEATEPAQTATTPTQNGEQQQTAQLNPQHGLPGHRCDIPVGAPLNSTASAQQMTTQNTSQNTTQSSTVSPIRVDQTPRVNPPHGQPGHDCSVPVGAELKQQ